jgi:hypothetical protein
METKKHYNIFESGRLLEALRHSWLVFIYLSLIDVYLFILGQCFNYVKNPFEIPSN